MTTRKQRQAPKTHSPIGASSMHRWSACPGSVRLSKGIHAPTSKYAAEGTAAHDLAEVCLRHPALPASQYLGHTRQAQGHDFVVSEEMADGVQLYVDTVRADIGPFDEIFIEHSFDLSEVYPGLYGTDDAIVWKPNERKLIVYDFKYGAGVPVEVFGSKQLRYYGLAALVTLKLPATEVELVIVQPRCPHADGPVRRWTFDAVEMMDFMVDLRQAAVATEDPQAPLAAGEHCRFCPAAALCPEKRAEADRAASLAFSAPTTGAVYDVQKLAEALTLARSLEHWVNSVHEFAYAEAERGVQIQGYKLVDKVARRKWKDETAAELALRKAGLGEAQLYGVPVIQSPAQIEEVLKGLKLKPAERQGVLDPLVEKKSSGHALVPDSDKRQAVTRQSAAEVFADA